MHIAFSMSRDITTKKIYQRTNDQKVWVVMVSNAFASLVFPTLLVHWDMDQQGIKRFQAKNIIQVCVESYCNLSYQNYMLILSGIMLLQYVLQDYEKRWQKLRRENLSNILFHGIQNFLLICPLIYLYNTASVRHKLLEDTIGAVPHEIEAMDRIYLLMMISLLLVILSIPLQVTLLYAFNMYGHPWKRFFNEFFSQEKQSRRYGFVYQSEEIKDGLESLNETSQGVCKVAQQYQGTLIRPVIYCSIAFEVVLFDYM